MSAVRQTAACSCNECQRIDSPRKGGWLQYICHRFQSAFAFDVVKLVLLTIQPQQVVVEATVAICIPRNVANHMRKAAQNAQSMNGKNSEYLY